MLFEWLAALAAAVGLAIVGAVGTDVWAKLRDAVARLFDRGKPVAPPLAVTPSTEDTSMVLTWLVDAEIGDVPDVTARQRERYGPPARSADFDNWLHAHRMDLPLFSRLKLLIEGTSAQAVILERLRFRVVERSTPQGLALTVETGAVGAALEPRWFTVDLGSHSVCTPKPRFDDTPDFPYQVHQADPELFVIDLEWGHEDLEWVMELDWSCSGNSGSLRIDDDGKPFRTTTVAGRPHYVWDLSRPERGWQAE